MTNPDDASGTLPNAGEPRPRPTPPKLAAPADIAIGRAATVRVTEPQSLLPGTKVGDYEIEKRIGVGAMSEVYLALHPTIGRRVAIKVISPRLFTDPDAMERFIGEARAVAEIHHPGIVAVFGFGRFDDGRAYLIMEWLRGQNLGERLAQGPIPLHDALEIILQLANALRVAHEHEIVHRDLKPENIFLEDIKDEKPLVKILDFGLAKRTHERNPSTSTSGQLIGTPLYMSPEQCRGKGVDHRSDIYALGCICYQLLTGRLPFDADQSVAELLAAHLTEVPASPRVLGAEIPESLDITLHALVAKDPRKRPSLSDLRRAIQTQLGLHSGVMSAVAAPDAPELPETTTDQDLPLRAPGESVPAEIITTTRARPAALRLFRRQDNDERTRRQRPAALREIEEAPTVDGNPRHKRRATPLPAPAHSTRAGQYWLIGGLILLALVALILATLL